MQNRGLLFIPDISGFTQFINETEIEHSRLIIQELLEVLINTNKIGLQVSEIEGDAILFYKFGESPRLEELYRQVEEMFCAFHSQLKAYDFRKFCYCKACTSAIKLTLKVITHYGEFTGYRVKNFQKLLGKDVIVAHQLLKNNIEQHEYWLVTTSVAHETPDTLAPWMQWNRSGKQTGTGEVSFYYTQLTDLKNNVQAEPVPKLHLEKKKKLISLSDNYSTDIITLFHATGDFNFRSQWRKGIERIEEVTHILPRVGTRCRCLKENGESVIYASSYYYSPEHIEFSETDESDNSTTYYTLHKIDSDHTSLTIDYYLPKKFFTELLFRIKRKKKMEEELQESLAKLHDLVKKLNFAIQL